MFNLSPAKLAELIKPFNQVQTLAEIFVFQQILWLPIRFNEFESIWSIKFKAVTEL